MKYKDTQKEFVARIVVEAAGIYTRRYFMLSILIGFVLFMIWF